MSKCFKLKISLHNKINSEVFFGWFVTSVEGAFSGYLRIKMVFVGLMFFLTLPIVVVSNAYATDRHHFLILESTADVSLVEFAIQSNLTLAVPFDEVKHVETQSVKGFYSIEKALSLLLADTVLESKMVGQQLKVTLNNSRGATMNKINKINQAILAAGVLASAPIGTLNAQSVDDEVVLEEVVVFAPTGSRIVSNGNASQPITSISSGDIASVGALTASELLNELPQLGDSLEGGSSINSLNSGFGVGTQTINLRNLGANRALVLVNGRRHVGGNVGTSAVDLSSIPVGLIERIDVLTGAASAVYGADAVTGVVNIILKEDYEGSSFGVRFGSSSESDGDEVGFNFTNGGKFKGGDYIVSAEYSTQDPIFGRDRSFAQFDGSASTGLSAAANGSGVNPGGLFSSANAAGTGGFNANGEFVSPFSERFQRVPFRSLQNETDRLVISGRASFDVSETIEFFAEGTYANTESTVEFEPQLAIFSDAAFGTSGAAGFRFPGVDAVSVNGDSLGVITRRFSEFGSRSSEVDRDLIRATLGFKGELSESIDFEVYYQYGEVEATQTDFNTIDKFRLASAIDPAVCSTIAGCQFVDVFGRGTIDPNSLSFVSSDLESTSESTQQVLSGFISGELFELGAGSVAYAIGAEYRDEDAQINPNANLLAVDNPLNPGVGQLVGTQGTRTFFGNTDGDFDVTEVFGELNVPLTDRLNTTLSARFSDYSTVGSEFTYGLSASFAATDALTFRGSFGRATRAPNVLELFNPDQAGTSAIVDPCDTLSDGGASLSAAASCAQLGFGPGFNPSDLDQQIQAVNGGNPNLDSETADTFTLGAVFQLGDKGFFSLDYYSIDLEDVLAPAFGPQATLDRCIATGDSFFCDNITRDQGTSFVRSIRSEQVNLANEEVSGLDFAFTKTWDISAGEVNFKVNYTRLFDHDRQVNDEAEVEDLVNRVDNIEDKVNFTTSYRNDTWTAGLTGRYLGSAKQSVDESALSAAGNNIDSQFYLDLFLAYNFGEKVTLSAGVENVTDEESPVVTQLFENNGSADTTAAGIYDVRGAFYYVNASYRF